MNVIVVYPNNSVIEVIVPGIQGPPPTGISLGDLAAISSLADDDKLLIFDQSESLSRSVRLDALKVYFNS